MSDGSARRRRAAWLVLAALALSLLLLAGRSIVVRFVEPAASPTDASDDAAPTSPAPTRVRVRLPQEHARDAVRVTVRSTDGEPLRGAVVELFRGPERSEFATDDDEFRPSVDAPKPAFVADADGGGAAALDDVPTGRWFVAAAAPGHGRRAVGVTRDARGADAEVFLAPGKRFSGTVADAAGAPLAGADVVLAPTQFTIVWPSDASCLRTTSDAAGAYVFDAVAPGEYRVWVRPAPGVIVCEGRVLLPALDRLDLRLVRGGEIDGVVRDADTGSPVAGAKIVAAPNSRNAQSTGEATCDGDGKFALFTWRPVAEVGEIRVDAPGYAPIPIDGSGRVVPTYVADGQRVNVEVRVRRGFVVSGTATGPTGLLVGAMVEIRRDAEDPSDRDSMGRTTTDADGRYRIERVPAGHATVQIDVVDSAYYSPQPVATTDVVVGGDATCDVRVEAKTCAVSGRVVDPSGNPIAGASVATYLGLLDVATTTDGDGRFAFAPWHVRGEDYVGLVFRSDGFAPVHESVSDERHDCGDVTLHPFTVDRGRVLDADGNPVANARVALELGEAGMCTFIFFWPGAVEAVSDAQGRFEVPITTSDGDMLCPYSPETGTRWNYRSPRSVNDEAPVDEPDVQLVRVERVAGRVVASGTREPVVGAVVWAGTDDDYATAVGRTDAHGAFDVPLRREDQDALKVSADGFVDAHASAADVRAGAAVEMLPSLSIDGVVTDADGRPRLDADVHVSQAGVQSDVAVNKTCSTDSAGRFVVRALPPGRFSVSVEPRNDEPTPPEIEVSSGTSGLVLKTPAVSPPPPSDGR